MCSPLFGKLKSIDKRSTAERTEHDALLAQHLIEPAREGILVPVLHLHMGLFIQREFATVTVTQAFLGGGGSRLTCLGIVGAPARNSPAT